MTALCCLHAEDLIRTRSEPGCGISYHAALRRSASLLCSVVISFIALVFLSRHDEHLFKPEMLKENLQFCLLFMKDRNVVSVMAANRYT